MTIHQFPARSAPLDRATPPDNATTHIRSRAGTDNQFPQSRPDMGSKMAAPDRKGRRHAPVTRAGCTRKEGYQNSETDRLCRGLESPVASPISGDGHNDLPRFAYVLERRNEPEPRPWLESNLAMMILCAAIFALTWMLADHVWTQITSEPGILTE